MENTPLVMPKPIFNGLVGELPCGVMQDHNGRDYKIYRDKYGTLIQWFVENKM